MERGITTLITNGLGLAWRRQWIVYLCLLLTSGVAMLYFRSAGERYEVSTLLRVGQGIKERSGNANTPLGEGIDLQSRMESLARMAKIDFVIHEAAAKAGYDRLVPPRIETPLFPSLQDIAPAPMAMWFEQVFAPLRTKDADRDGNEARPTNDVQAAIDRNYRAIAQLREQVTAKQEGRADLLRIQFRHKDPALAARFLDELANALVAIHNTDVQLPGAQEFFQQQTKRLEQEAEAAAADLQNFSVKESIYSVDDQRLLLLRRANELSTSIASTRALVEERKGQKRAIVDQLEILKPVTQSRTVSRVVRTLGGQVAARTGDSSTRESEQLEETPPLLLVKVYQDNMASLMKLNAELNGATELLRQLDRESENVSRQLALLAAQEAEYARLKRVFATASTAAAHYGSRMAEEQINSEVAKKAQLSSLRVVQMATLPKEPVFPQFKHLVVLGVLGGIVLGLAIIFGMEFARRSMQSNKSSAADGTEDAAAVNLLNLLVARQRKEALRDNHTA